MNADSTLSLKCPSCGNRTQKSLAAIKSQTSFDCACGYHAELLPGNLLKPRDSVKPAPSARPSTVEKEDELAISA